MITVIDASVVIAALVDHGDSGHWAEAIILRDNLAAPELMLIEASNVLRRLESNGAIGNHEAESAAQQLLNLDILLYPFKPLAEVVWSFRNNITSYDATYVALANSLAAPLATLDLRLASQTDFCEFLTPS